jgi:CRISP-associated protein Cas1
MIRPADRLPFPDPDDDPQHEPDELSQLSAAEQRAQAANRPPSPAPDSSAVRPMVSPVDDEHAQQPTGGSRSYSLDLDELFSAAGENAVTDEADLIPARMLNEFAYCPRLAYLEWVQSEFRDNLETMQGSFGHRRVDRPDARPFPSPQLDADSAESADVATSDDPPAARDHDSATSSDASAGTTHNGPLLPDQLAARGLLLSAMSEGLMAKLDLVELTGRRAVPIDYKRGAIPDNGEQSWEPERVQLCAQGLILRANGYECDSGQLYYIESRRRVTIPFDDVLIRQTRELVGQLQELARRPQIPPPLVDSPKCPRCSLVSICLPDETNLLRQLDPSPLASGSTADDEPLESTQAHANVARPAAPDPKPLRKLLPARDDALPLYVQDQGTYIGKDGERLKLTPVNAKSIFVPLIQVSQVAIFGNVQISSAALRELANLGIPLCHFSYGGWFTAMTTGMSHRNVELRLAQYQAAQSSETALAIAKPIIAAKIRNSRTLLRRHGGGELKPDLEQLSELIQKVDRQRSLDSLRGIEGTAARLYFSGFARLLRQGEHFQLQGRNRRPPRDPVNALLSFVYALLTKDLTITVHAVGFDPFLGFLHQPRYGRPSLALDLAEEFRPIVGDSVVLTLINNEEVSPASFVNRAGSVALTDKGRKAVMAAYERRMETEITHPLFGYKVTYRRILEVQARLLSRVLLGEVHEYPGFCTR